MNEGGVSDDEMHKMISENNARSRLVFKRNFTVAALVAYGGLSVEDAEARTRNIVIPPWRGDVVVCPEKGKSDE